MGDRASGFVPAMMLPEPLPERAPAPVRSGEGAWRSSSRGGRVIVDAEVGRGAVDLGEARHRVEAVAVPLEHLRMALVIGVGERGQELFLSGRPPTSSGGQRPTASTRAG